MRKRRILFAANDIGWRIEHYSQFIKKNYGDRLTPDSFVNYIPPTSLYKTRYTYQHNYTNYSSIKRWIYSLFYFFKFLFTYDIFHFFSGETILTRKTRKLEFTVYKLFGKRIVMHFVGADIRNTEYIEWKEKNITDYIKGKKGDNEPLVWQQKLIADTKKYADHVLVSTPDLLKIYKGDAVYLPVFIDLKRLKEEVANIDYVKSEQVTILHLPSHPVVKGSRIIEPVLKDIKSKYGEEVKLILRNENKDSRYSVSRYELFKQFLEADIVIDQLIVGWFGLQAIEAVYLENQVISYVEEDLKAHLFPGCPIFSADAINLGQRIEEAISRKQKGEYDFQSAKEWVEKYHVIENNADVLTNAWQLNV